MLTKIISGGQTGADQGALAAAKELGIPTGGTAPKGYRTDTGNNFDLCLTYGLSASPHRDYGPRTKENVISSDGTLLFGSRSLLISTGTRLTERICFAHNKPNIHIHWLSGEILANHDEIPQFLNWLRNNNIQVLNVAGNRERTNPGIFQATKDFLIEALRGAC